MKVEIDINHKQEVAYPYFGSSDGNILVLFIAPNTGVEVKGMYANEDYTYNAVGDYKTDWNEIIFEPLPKGSKVTFTV